MNSLKKLACLDIDWNLAPEDAVVIYLEWGNNNWHGDHAPVRSKQDESIYFVVDTWEDTPVIRLIRRNSETSHELASFPLPSCLFPSWREENGHARGIFAPNESIKSWLKKQIEDMPPCSTCLDLPRPQR